MNWSSGAFRPAPFPSPLMARSGRWFRPRTECARCRTGGSKSTSANSRRAASVSDLAVDEGNLLFRPCGAPAAAIHHLHVLQHIVFPAAAEGKRGIARADAAGRSSGQHRQASARQRRGLVIIAARDERLVLALAGGL